MIDVSALRSSGDESSGEESARREVADQIRRACRDHGFFYVRGHGVSQELVERLQATSREFFALDLERKMSIRMELGGRAWRGYFPLGAELTSGKPDQKEGLYLGAELPESHPRVLAKTPLFGRNLFLEELPEFRRAVLDYVGAMTELGHRLMSGIALSLFLEADHFAETVTADPLVLFRIFRYPPLSAGQNEPELWSVGEHTDYGLLTLLLQDDVGGLEVKTPDGRGGWRWIEAPPIPGTLVCNLGDMLDRMTGGLYRSTPHRVVNRSGRERYSFPFFFDPGFDAEIAPIQPGQAVVDDAGERWDRASVHVFEGTYGEYLVKKVSKVFPQLVEEVLPEESGTQSGTHSGTP